MTSRKFMAEQLERIRSWWPSLQTSETALNEFCRLLAGFPDPEIERAVDHVIATHKESWAPKPAHLLEFLGGTRFTLSPAVAADAPVCAICGARELTERDGRLAILHVASCRLADPPAMLMPLDLGTLRAERAAAAQARALASVEAEPVGEVAGGILSALEAQRGAR